MNEINPKFTGNGTENPEISPPIVDPSKPEANFTPSFQEYTNIRPFRYWVQSVLPLVYDDSLSYQELLGKVVNYLNDVINNVNATEYNMEQLRNAYIQLQNYVNEYYNSLDVQEEINNKLDAMAADGSLTNLIEPLVNNKLPSTVAGQINGVVANQIDGVVANQIDGSVNKQIDDAVDPKIGPVVTQWLENNITNTETSPVVDASLTISGAAADAKTVGDKFNAVETDIKYISQPSINLWPYGNQSFTNYRALDLALPAGDYTFSANITTTPSCPSVLIYFYDASDKLITAINVTISSNTNVRSVLSFNLTRASTKIFLFSGNTSSGSGSYDATYANIQIEKGLTAHQYVPPLSARDTVLEATVTELAAKSNFFKNQTKNFVPDTIELKDLDFIQTNDNLFDYNDPKNQSGYLTIYDTVAPNDNYVTSWYIPVKPNTLYYVGGGYYPDYTYTAMPFLAEYDINYNQIAYYPQFEIKGSFTTHDNTKYIRLSYRSIFNSAYVFISEKPLVPGKAPLYQALIPRKLLDVNLPAQHFTLKAETLSDALYDANTANSIRHQDYLTFTCNISNFNSLELGFAWVNLAYKHNHILIDNINITTYTDNGTPTVIPHGLTLENNLQIIVKTSLFRQATIILISNGKSFTLNQVDFNRRRVCFPYVLPISCTLTKVVMSYTCGDFNKDYWIFGDSYTGGYTDNWFKYAHLNNLVPNCLWDAFPGATSHDAWESLQNLFPIAKPKKIVWTTGMNDGSDANNLPSTNWIEVQNKLRPFCHDNNIELILATIPSVPTINNQYKNADIRVSGYRYIDWATAVGAQANGTWFAGMLSDDGVHPSDYGALALFGQVMADFPEIAIQP